MGWFSKLFGDNEKPSAPEPNAMPMPKVVAQPDVIADFNYLEPVMFHDSGKTLLVMEHNTDANADSLLEFYVLVFKGVISAHIGSPNDEALGGHPLAKCGLTWYQFHEVFNSPLIAELEHRNRAHHRHDAALYENNKHYIITFKDETFEVVCTSYTKQLVKAASAKEVVAEQLKVM